MRVSACVERGRERERKRERGLPESRVKSHRKKKSSPHTLSLSLSLSRLPPSLSSGPSSANAFGVVLRKKGKRNLSLFLFFGFSLFPSLRLSPSPYLFYRGFYPSSCFKRTHSHPHTHKRTQTHTQTHTNACTHTHTHARERAAAKEAFLRQM